jgi:glutaredoxin-like YruB-family protein
MTAPVFMALALALAATPVDEAKAHLKAGRLDDVLFALDGKSFSDEERTRAAAVLGLAAEAANQKADALLALQFAQMALKLEPGELRALEAAARSAFAAQQFGAAEAYADRWLRAEPRNGAARLLRAELAFEAGEWGVVLDQLDQARQLKGPQGDAAAVLRAKATQEVAERRNALSSIATLERRVAAAAAKAKSGGGGFTRPLPAQGSASVVVYTTAWCGYCKKMKSYLKKRGVDFIEKDIEKDPEAERELAQKAAAAHVDARGVPVTDIRGKLIVGFDTQAVDAAL